MSNPLTLMLWCITSECVQVPNTAMYLGVNVWTLTESCRLHGPIIDWFRSGALSSVALDPTH